MANKTTKGRLAKYPSTALTFKLYALGSDTVANGSGDAATTGAGGGFSFDVTENISGWFDVVAYDGASVRGTGTVFYPGDVAGTYLVDDPNSPVVLPAVSRSSADINPIVFWWPVSGEDLSGTVIKTEGGVVGTSQAIQGEITPTGRVANGQYEYKLAYDPDDRPATEGIADYTIVGAATTGYLALTVSPRPSADITTSTTVIG